MTGGPCRTLSVLSWQRRGSVCGAISAPGLQASPHGTPGLRPALTWGRCELRGKAMLLDAQRAQACHPERGALRSLFCPRPPQTLPPVNHLVKFLSQVCPNWVHVSAPKARCLPPAGAQGGKGRGLLTAWLSSSFLSAGLSVWEAAFLLTQGGKRCKSAPEGSHTDPDASAGYTLVHGGICGGI